MPKPFLHFGDIGLMREGIGGGGSAERMHTQADDIAADTRHQSVMADDVAIDGSGIERPL